MLLQFFLNSEVSQKQINQSNETETRMWKVIWVENSRKRDRKMQKSSAPSKRKIRHLLNLVLVCSAGAFEFSSLGSRERLGVAVRYAGCTTEMTLSHASLSRTCTNGTETQDLNQTFHFRLPKQAMKSVYCNNIGFIEFSQTFK